MSLGESQLRTLAAAIDRIVGAADDAPDDRQQGARLMANHLIGRIERSAPHLMPLYELGLDALEAEARAAGALTFDVLPEAQRDALLMNLEGDLTLTAWPVPASMFYRMLVEHCGQTASAASNGDCPHLGPPRQGA
jgi:hypothetical protein